MFYFLLPLEQLVKSIGMSNSQVVHAFHLCKCLRFFSHLGCKCFLFCKTCTTIGFVRVGRHLSYPFGILCVLFKFFCCDNLASKSTSSSFILGNKSFETLCFYVTTFCFSPCQTCCLLNFCIVCVHSTTVTWDV